MAFATFGKTISRAVRSGTLQALVSSRMESTKVLFCGEEFAGAYEFTRQAMEAAVPDVQVTRCKRSEVPKFIGDAHVAIPMMSRLDADLLRRGEQLRLILQFGVGVEGIDIPAATELGIWVSNIPSEATGNALSCAEMAIYLAFSCLRHVSEMSKSVQQRLLGVPVGETLFGKTVLVVGFGNIARELVPRLKPFGVRLVAVRRSPWTGNHDAEKLLDYTGSWEELPSLASSAHIIILACVLNDITRGMINRPLLAACLPGVHIINVARGGLLDYDAVVEGLDSGRIGGLGLDVQWNEPWDPTDYITSHPRVVMTPHVAGATLAAVNDQHADTMFIPADYKELGCSTSFQVTLEHHPGRGCQQSTTTRPSAFDMGHPSKLSEYEPCGGA